MTIQKSVSGLQIWLLLAVLGASVSILTFFAYNMYMTFDGLQKSVNQISSNIAVIQNDQKHQIIESTQMKVMYENVYIKLNDVDRRVLKLEFKVK